MGDKEQILAAIEQDRDLILEFYRGFIRAKSPNPPGDTREAAGYVSKFLTEQGLSFRTIAPMPEFPKSGCRLRGWSARPASRAQWSHRRFSSR